MADPVDRWHLARPPAGAARCSEHGMVPSAAHGVGDRWQARWRDATGAQHKQNFARKTDAARHQVVTVADIARGTHIDARLGKITLGEYAPRVLAASAADVTSRERAGRAWRVHILPALGAVQLGTLAARPSMIQAFIADLSRAQLASNTVESILWTLSGVLKAAVNDGLIPRNPCSLVKAPRDDMRRIVPWTAERVAAVRAGLPGCYQAVADVGAGLGLRQGEALGLAVDDIDFLRRVVHVRRQVRIAGYRRVFAPPKYGKERDVPLPDSVALRLSAHIATRPPVSVALPWRAPEGNDETARLLFSSPQGSVVSANLFNPSWRAARNAAGCPPGRSNGFHALRHHFASVLLRDGVDIRSLSEHLGHHDPGFTLRVYCHLMPDSGDRMRAAIDRALTAEGHSTEGSFQSDVPL